MDGGSRRQRHPRLRWAVAGFVLVLCAVIVLSVFWAGSEGVESAGSAAHLPIPSSTTVHLERRHYMVSFAVYHSSSPGLQVPQLHLSIADAATGERLELRRPPKRFFSVSGDEKVEEQYMIAVPAAGGYDVQVSADAPTSGTLLIGDRPIDALGRLVRTWVIIIGLGGLLCFAAAIAVLARRGRLGLTVTRN